MMSAGRFVKTVGTVFTLMLAAGAMYGAVAQEETAAPAPSPGASPQAEAEATQEFARNIPPGSCLSDPAVIEELRRQREALRAKQAELAARDVELKAREAALNEEFRKIEAARADMQKIETARGKESEEKVGKLVETLQSMNPKASSQLLSSVDEALAVAAMARIEVPKLAKIMNVMDPKRSARLSELLAGVVRARDAVGIPRQQPVSNGAAETTAPQERGIRKGGERQNDEHNQSDQQRNARPAGTG